MLHIQRKSQLAVHRAFLCWLQVKHGWRRASTARRMFLLTVCCIIMLVWLNIGLLDSILNILDNDNQFSECLYTSDELLHMSSMIIIGEMKCGTSTLNKLFKLHSHRTLFPKLISSTSNEANFFSKSFYSSSTSQESVLSLSSLSTFSHENTFQQSLLNILNKRENEYSISKYFNTVFNVDYLTKNELKNLNLYEKSSSYMIMPHIAQYYIRQIMYNCHSKYNQFKSFKFIILLRNPIDRTVSQFWHQKQLYNSSKYNQSFQLYLNDESNKKRFNILNNALLFGNSKNKNRKYKKNKLSFYQYYSNYYSNGNNNNQIESSIILYEKVTYEMDDICCQFGDNIIESEYGNCCQFDAFARSCYYYPVIYWIELIKKYMSQSYSNHIKLLTLQHLTNDMTNVALEIYCWVVYNTDKIEQCPWRENFLTYKNRGAESGSLMFDNLQEMKTNKKQQLDGEQRYKLSKLFQICNNNLYEYILKHPTVMLGQRSFPKWT